MLFAKGLCGGSDGLGLAAPIRALIPLPALPGAAQLGTRRLRLHQNCSYAKNHNCGKTTVSLLKTLSKKEIISLFLSVHVIFFLSRPSFMPVPSLFVTGVLDAGIKGELLSPQRSHPTRLLLRTAGVSETLLLSARSIAALLH